LRGGAGYARARELLESGAALRQMQKIIEAQGPTPYRPEVGALTADMRAAKAGVVSTIDCLRVNRLARTAGARTRGRGSSCSRRSATASIKASHFTAFTRLNRPSSS